MAYSGWNTAGNTIGSVVAAAVATVVGTREETLDRTAARRHLSLAALVRDRLHADPAGLLDAVRGPERRQVDRRRGLGGGLEVGHRGDAVPV
ncbi:DUF4127 family protein [Nonomuraea sp. NPDC052129]|uniref:DUF4127 family protein n=1 Tax=Nonomuraea sp. NPDC052129 TaxID=3154651 RepID=UPI0034312BA8